MAQARAELAVSHDEGDDESDFCPRELDFEAESDVTDDLKTVGVELWQSDDACDDTLAEEPPHDDEPEVQKVKEEKVREQMAKEMKEREAKDQEGLAKEAKLKEHLSKELEKEKMNASKVKTDKEIEVKEPSVNQSKGHEEEKKRPIATPQVATRQPTPEAGLLRKGSSMTAVADALNRTNTNDLSPTTPPPSSVTKSVDAPETVKGDTEKANDDESSDNEIPNPHKDLEDIPTETRLAMVSKGPKKRTKEQLAVHRKKQSFYRTLVSTGLIICES